MMARFFRSSWIYIQYMTASGVLLVSLFIVGCVSTVLILSDDRNNAGVDHLGMTMMIGFMAILVATRLSSIFENPTAFLSPRYARTNWFVGMFWIAALSWVPIVAFSWSLEEAYNDLAMAVMVTGVIIGLVLQFGIHVMSVAGITYTLSFATGYFDGRYMIAVFNPFGDLSHYYMIVGTSLIAWSYYLVVHGLRYNDGGRFSTGWTGNDTRPSEWWSIALWSRRFPRSLDESGFFKRLIAVRLSYSPIRTFEWVCFAAMLALAWLAATAMHEGGGDFVGFHYRPAYENVEIFYVDFTIILWGLIAMFSSSVGIKSMCNGELLWLQSGFPSKRQMMSSIALFFTFRALFLPVLSFIIGSMIFSLYGISSFEAMVVLFTVTLFGISLMMVSTPIAITLVLWHLSLPYIHMVYQRSDLANVIPLATALLIWLCCFALFVEHHTAGRSDLAMKDS
ncbi:MAG: hypothetical protein AAF525_22455 [Pseudomonadota bacterium]